MPNMIPMNTGADKFGVASIRGNLDQVHVAKLLFGFFKARKTGILAFNDGFDDLIVYLFKGCPVLYVRGLYDQDDFAQYLSRFGLIAAEELEKFRKKAEQEKTTALRLLLNQRVVDEAMVRRLAERYYEVNLLGLFSWRRGEYRFYEKSGLPGFEGEADPLRTLRRIIDGIRQRYHAGMIETRLEKRAQTPLKIQADPPIPLDELLLTDDERQIAAWIGEGATLAEIIEKSALKPNDARALVFALLTLESAKFESKGKTRRIQAEMPAPAGSILNRLFRQAEASVERIQRQVQSEEATKRQLIKDLGAERVDLQEIFPDEGPESPAPPADDATAELRRRLQQKIQELQNTVAALETVAAGKKLTAPEEKPLTKKEQSLADLLNASIDAAETTRQPRATIVTREEAEPEEFAPLESAPDAVTGGAENSAAERPLSSAPFEESEAAESPAAEEWSTAEEPPAAEEWSSAEEPPAADEWSTAEEPPAEAESVAPAVADEPAFADLPDLPEPEAEAAPEFSENDPPVQLFQMAVALLDQEEWERAYRALTIALEHGYDTPEATVYQGWAFYNAFPNEPDRFIQAATLVQEGIDQNPAKATGYVVLGKMYFAERDRSMAELYFVKALEVDHDCREAKEYIRRIYQER